jgi:hypothetical protein
MLINISLKKIIMKFYLPVLILCFIAVTLTAQNKIELDASPMDLGYYPVNYPVLKVKEKVKEPLISRVFYGRPAKNGRTIFGELIEYGKIWRLGANEATEIEFFRDVIISKVSIKKGRYTLYAIPFEEKWTIVLNKETDTWGSFKYDMQKDVVREDVPVLKQTEITEIFTIYFEKTLEGIGLHITWDNLKVMLPISIPKKPD